MKWIKYQIVCNQSTGALLDKRIGYSDENIAIAEAEAYNGEYTIEEDGKTLEQIVSITHNLNVYPHCDLYEYDYGYGVGGAGEGPAGGGSLVSAPNFIYEMPDKNNIKIRVDGMQYAIDAVNKVADDLYVISFVDGNKSLIVKLKI